MDTLQALVPVIVALGLVAGAVGQLIGTAVLNWFKFRNQLVPVVAESNRLADMVRDVDDTRKRNADLQEQLTNMRKIQTGLEDDNAGLRRRVRMVEEENLDLKLQVAALIKERDSMRLVIASANEQITSLRDELKEAREEIRKLHETLREPADHKPEPMSDGVIRYGPAGVSQTPSAPAATSGPVLPSDVAQ